MLLSFLLGLATMAGQCQAGYYCAGQADRQDPTDGTTGNICPPGRYCGKLLGKFCYEYYRKAYLVYLIMPDCKT